jgi:solute:Na+ symporter, SSS family
MSSLDWIVLICTLSFIIIYGIVKSKGAKNIQTYLLADKQLPWYHVGLSVMATQASAITFLSAPGQGFNDGLRFVQFYFGLPLAMVVLCITFIPMFSKLNVFTAYEFIEKRFDNRTRLLTAFLFLLQRGLSTGVTIYAPAIILSTILGIDVTYTIIANGILVIIYTVYGGTKAVSYTQLLQMSIIFGGLFLAGYMVVHLLPANVGFQQAMHIAGSMQKLNAIDTKFDWHNKYNLWSGIIGGFFLQLSYFGTDQSQVGRYLTGSSIKQSRLGLLMNAAIKIPMQFFILLLGVMVFVFYQFNTAPIYFNPTASAQLQKSLYADSALQLQNQYASLANTKQALILDITNLHTNNMDQAMQVDTQMQNIKKQYTGLVKNVSANGEASDTNYVFLYFITHQLPVGIVGLLIAIIFLAAMGSTASGLNSLASTFVIDFYKALINKNGTDAQYLNASRWATLGWGIFCIIVAFFASRLGNLIEAVNILGSLFYGTILGIFLVAFYIKQVQAKAVFIAAILTEIIIVYAWYTDVMAFLWLNVLGCICVCIVSWLLQITFYKSTVLKKI